MREVGERIKGLDEKLKTVETEFENLAYRIPNMPHLSVPEGEGAEDNQEVRRWGNPKTHSFAPKDHADFTAIA